MPYCIKLVILKEKLVYFNQSCFSYVNGKLMIMLIPECFSLFFYSTMQSRNLYIVKVSSGKRALPLLGIKLYL